MIINKFRKTGKKQEKNRKIYLETIDKTHYLYSIKQTHMTTLQVYTEIATDVIKQSTQNVSKQQLESNFKRYAKTYKLAYSVWPNDHSLSIQLTQYGGLAIYDLKTWLKEIQK